MNLQRLYVTSRHIGSILNATEIKFIQRQCRLKRHIILHIMYNSKA